MRAVERKFLQPFFHLGPYLRHEMAISSEFLKRTITYWQRFYGEDLTQEDAREIVENICSLFNLLNELDGDLENKNENSQKQENSSFCEGVKDVNGA